MLELRRMSFILFLFIFFFTLRSGDMSASTRLFSSLAFSLSLYQSEKNVAESHDSDRFSSVTSALYISLLSTIMGERRSDTSRYS